MTPKTLAPHACTGGEIATEAMLYRALPRSSNERVFDFGGLLNYHLIAGVETVALQQRFRVEVHYHLVSHLEQPQLLRIVLAFPKIVAC